MPNVMTTQEEGCSLWQFIPDSVLLHVFSYLPTRILLNASQVCKVWHRVAMDEYLWKDLLYRMWHIDTHIPMAPGKLSWLQEFRRLYYHTPQIESEVLRDHRDQVLHISFSHNGQMFATSSKDGYVKVWTASYPSRVKYYADMREFTWKYTQFSQFNETDTLLLVSGVHFGAHSTSGEIAVFNLVDGFELQCRVLNKPYDIFGTWYNETYLLSGNLHWLGHLTSCSVLWLNKASQALEAENESVVMRLYKFRNINASSIRTVMIAKCHDDDAPMKTAAVNAPQAPAPVTSSVGSPQPSTSSGPVGQQQCGILPPTCPPSSQTAHPLVLSTPAAAAAGTAATAVPPPPCQEDMSMKGADTSQSECSQGKSKRKESRIKMWQKVQVLTDGDRGVRLLEVDDSNDDGEETIEYNMDYRRAESHLMEVCGGCGDPETEERLGALAGLLPFGDVDMFDDSQDGEDNQASFPARTEAPPRGDQQPGALGGGHSGGQWGGAGRSDYRSGQLSRTGDYSRKGGSSKSRQMSPAAATGASRSCRSNAAAATNDPPPPVGVAKCFSNPHGDINVNTDSTGNNNSNPFSLHPLFAPSPPSASPPCAPVPSASGDSPHQPIGATCSAAAPQPLPSTLAGCRMAELDFTGTGDRYLIFTTGMKTYTPHQIGIKRIRSLEEACPADVKESPDGLRLLPNVADNDYGMKRDEFDTVDHLIELHGHIIGMCLSPDHRYLYVNSRPWPQGYEIDDPLYPPPIAQEIDIHVIDLTTMHEVGTMHRAHKAYTPNDECFFIFLDVCHEYVASGAEDKHGYLWDRHYGVCLTKFPHADVVNSVAFNPQDPEMLITASDDNSLKIWRSRNRELQVKGHLTKVTEPGSPLHRENRENGQRNSLSGKTQGI